MPSMGIAVAIRHDVAGMRVWRGVVFMVMPITWRRISLAASVTADMSVSAALNWDGVAGVTGMSGMSAVCVGIGRGGGMARTFVAPMIMGSGWRRLRAHAAQRGLEVALGIDQEVRRDDHFVAILDALDHFYVTIAASAELDFARLEAAFAFLYDNDLARAAVDDGGSWNGDDRAFGRNR